MSELHKNNKAVKQLPDWEDVLSSATRLQELIPNTTLVGGSASAFYAGHRLSVDADHVLTDLRDHFDEVLAALESVAGWKTARIKRPVLILGSLDGIETGIRQLIRSAPLETCQFNVNGKLLQVPTEQEMLRIKAVLILKRNSTRDYLDFVALADHLGNSGVISGMDKFDQFYPQDNGESVTQQLQIQLANPLPFDLEDMDLSQYKKLDERWHNWANVKGEAQNLSLMIMRDVLSKTPAGSPSM